ncbi:hypothetical protein J2S06_001294 [Bacillus alveayuensis]|uniref:Uncharacterized protein n=1 Tax=Aeribacillus alveayuensis TaxID=279215 RepID=A0ABT9VML7_9BACI|nr:hypothetical protein [Bacillus alveayuensis]
MITCLQAIHSFELTDAAIAAKAVYQFYEQQSLEVLKSSAVGKMMIQYGYENELQTKNYSV